MRLGERLLPGDKIAYGAGLVIKAANFGINYFDTADTYSNGYAPQILRSAFQSGLDPDSCNLSVKVSGTFANYSADGAVRCIERSLSAMGIEKAAFGYLWAVRSLEEYMHLLQEGGVLEGLEKARGLGLINHICLSVHAPPEEIISMLEYDFAGITVSMSPINYRSMLSVIKAAEEKNMGIMTMNTLGGGIIPRNPDVFSYLRILPDESLSLASLRFVCGFPGITTVMSGMTNEDELFENLRAFESEPSVSYDMRLWHIQSCESQMDLFCTGCNYCDGCPVGIPVCQFMQGYNFSLFSNYNPVYGVTDQDLIKDINAIEFLTRKLSRHEIDRDNPCLGCGQCETKCTQKLPVISRLALMYQKLRKYYIQTDARKTRIYDLLIKPEYKKVILYPYSIFTKHFYFLLKELFSKITFQCFVCDKDEKKWGIDFADGICVEPPQRIAEIKPDAIVITSYNYTDAIFSELESLQNDGISIVKLRGEKDVPWWCL